MMYEKLVLGACLTVLLVSLSIDRSTANEVPVFEKFSQTDLETTKKFVKKLIDDNKEDGLTTFNAGYLRLSFHDCWGGCDGCIDFSNGGNGGLMKYWQPLFRLWKRKRLGGQTLENRMSFADLIAISGIVGVQYATTFQPGCEDGSCGPFIDYKVGRVDCANRTSPPNRKDFFFPGPHHDNAPKLGAEFNMTASEFTAILGSHTIGEMHDDVSAFDGKWTTNHTVFNNEYFKIMLDPKLNFRQEKNRIGHMFWKTDEDDVLMLGDDVALAHKTDVPKAVKGLSNCNLFKALEGKPACKASERREVVERLAKDNGHFYEVYGKSMTKVIHNTKGVELYNLGVEPPKDRNVIADTSNPGFNRQSTVSPTNTTQKTNRRNPNTRRRRRRRRRRNRNRIRQSTERADNEVRLVGAFDKEWPSGTRISLQRKKRSAEKLSRPRTTNEPLTYTPSVDPSTDYTTTKGRNIDGSMSTYTPADSDSTIYTSDGPVDATISTYASSTDSTSYTSDGPQDATISTYTPSATDSTVDGSISTYTPSATDSTSYTSEGPQDATISTYTPSVPDSTVDGSSYTPLTDTTTEYSSTTYYSTSNGPDLSQHFAPGSQLQLSVNNRRKRSVDSEDDKTPKKSEAGNKKKSNLRGRRQAKRSGKRRTTTEVATYTPSAEPSTDYTSTPYTDRSRGNGGASTYTPTDSTTDYQSTTLPYTSSTDSDPSDGHSSTYTPTYSTTDYHSTTPPYTSSTEGSTVDEHSSTYTPTYSTTDYDSTISRRTTRRSRVGGGASSYTPTDSTTDYQSTTPPYTSSTEGSTVDGHSSTYTPTYSTTDYDSTISRRTTRRSPVGGGASTYTPTVTEYESTISNTYSTYSTTVHDGSGFQDGTVLQLVKKRSVEAQSALTENDESL